MDDFSERIANMLDEPTGGTAAAAVAALAAAVAATAADRSRGVWEEAAGARAQALALRRRALGLAERGDAAHSAARLELARRAGHDAEPEPSAVEDRAAAARDWRLGTAVRLAADPPLELTAVAADIAELARAIAGAGADDVRADVAIAAALAAAAARAGARLVEINLVVGGDRELVARARGLAETADRAAAGAEPAA